ncbi:3-dehydroquinate synthase [Candidatus Poribacteria bacterium]|nr:3-dehydroquinate synthase [Candidatus Poribacteria bacterium]
MHKIRVQLPNDGYDIVADKGVIAELPGLLLALLRPSRILLVSNPSIDKHHGDVVRGALARTNCSIATELLPEGESHKTFQTVKNLLDRMVEARMDRASLLVSLGGGVVGDIAGFAAAIYMRGIPYVQAPTTLLAQVDSSIGGKVGVDHPLAKNMIGAFYQPVLVCVDPAILATLPETQMRNGMAEVIKYGVVADENLFALLERHKGFLTSIESGPLEEIVRRCCQIKARIVQQDIRETTGLRSILNYGHTIGHAIESVTGYTRFLHGEAISIGMMAAAKIARLMKIASDEVEKRQEDLLSAVGLPTRLTDIDPRALIEATRFDKKTTGGKVRFVLPLGIGRVAVRDNVPGEILEEALRELATR